MSTMTYKDKAKKVRDAGLENGRNDTGPDFEHWCDVDTHGNNIFDGLLESLGIPTKDMHPDETDALYGVYVDAFAEGCGSTFRVKRATVRI
jgi:hypothetical protein